MWNMCLILSRLENIFYFRIMASALSTEASGLGCLLALYRQASLELACKVVSVIFLELGIILHLFALKTCCNHLSDLLQHFKTFLEFNRRHQYIPLVFCNTQESHLVPFYIHINKVRVGGLNCAKYHSLVTRYPTRFNWLPA